MKKYLSKEGFDFKFEAATCESCEGNCCIGQSGNIWINSSEIKALANHLELNMFDFSQKYLKKVGFRYSLVEKQIDMKNYACIFFDLNKKCCTIYNFRPTQCKTFPFWEYFKTNKQEVIKECPAIKNI